jgi:MFS family permease
MAESSKKNISSNVFFIGLISFFGGISQDIFVPVLPLYLANVLGFSKEFIGLTEGLVTSSASIFKMVAGYLSDKLKKNKPIVFAGYFLSLVSRPLLAVLTSGVGVAALRFIDGVGKGVKDSPKDALVAESTQVESRGKGFGIVRALDTFGSVAGPLLLFALLYVLRNNTLKYHYIFFITAIPLIFTLSILSFFVKEAPVKKTEATKNTSPLPARFLWFLAIVLLFSIGNSSDTFLILRSQNLGVGLLGIPLVYALFNAVYASASIPLGSLSDKIGREKVILLGWFMYALSYFGFGSATKSYQAWLLFAMYGIYYATTEGVVKAYIADQVASGHRGKAYGLYNSLVGLVTLPASFITGFLWDKISPAAPFYFSAAIALLAAILLLIYTRVIKSVPAQQ